MGLFGWKKNAVPVETNEPEIKDKNIPNKSLVLCQDLVQIKMRGSAS